MGELSTAAGFDAALRHAVQSGAWSLIPTDSDLDTGESLIDRHLRGTTTDTDRRRLARAIESADHQAVV